MDAGVEVLGVFSKTSQEVLVEKCIVNARICTEVLPFSKRSHLEFSIARTAIAFTPMVHRVHVLISGVLAMKPSVTSIALELWCPVSRVDHMPISRVLAVESTVTGLAFELRRPMPCIIHVLTCRPLSEESSIARRPVVESVQMLSRSNLAAEHAIAYVALVFTVHVQFASRSQCID